MTNHAPMIRFKGFTDDWEQRKLGELVKITTGKLDANAMVENGKYDFYTSGIKKYKINTHAFEGPAITIAGNGATVGYMHYANGLFNAYQRTYVLNDFSGNREFLFQAIRNTLPKKIKQEARTGNIPYIVMDMLTELNIETPSSKEQKQIGSFFKQLDDTIALHQQKLNRFKEQKQAYLSQVFNQQTRFLGFDDVWEPYKLEALVDRVKSYSLSRDVETSDYTGYKYIHYGDIHTKVATLIDQTSDLPNIKQGNYETLEKGDLVLADASEDYQGIATPALITIDPPYKLVSGLHTIALRPNNANSFYLYYLIHSQLFRKYGYKVGTGMKVFGISFTNLMKFESRVPSMGEQVKIGIFFKKLDDLVQLQKEKIEQLNNLKKAFLQKMFI